MHSGTRAGDEGRRERGAALIVMMVTVMVAATLSLSLLLVATSRHRSMEARRSMEAALAVAEAGLARGMSEANLSANKSNPNWPPGTSGVDLAGTSTEVRDAESTTTVMGTFSVNLLSGLFDGKDNDGDGTPDDTGPPLPKPGENIGENVFIIVKSLGYYGPQLESNPNRVRVTGLIKIDRNPFAIAGALSVNGLNPDFKIGNSNAFDVSGWDHDDDSTTIFDPPDADHPGVPAVATVSPTLDPLDEADITGASGVDGPADLAKGVAPNPVSTIVEFAKANATFSTANKLPNSFDYENVIYHDGNTTLAGGDYGAGIWVVNGDLDYAGTCQFKGIMVVTGMLTIKGGGNDYLIRGCAIVGGDAFTEDFYNNGTTDIRFSSEAILKAMNAYATYSMVGWQQIAINNP